MNDTDRDLRTLLGEITEQHAAIGIKIREISNEFKEIKSLYSEEYWESDNIPSASATSSILTQDDVNLPDSIRKRQREKQPLSEESSNPSVVKRIKPWQQHHDRRQHQHNDNSSRSSNSGTTIIHQEPQHNQHQLPSNSQSNVQIQQIQPQPSDFQSSSASSTTLTTVNSQHQQPSSHDQIIQLHEQLSVQSQDNPLTTTITDNNNNNNNNNNDTIVSCNNNDSDENDDIIQYKKDNEIYEQMVISTPQYQHIPQSGVTGVSWYGGVGNNNYWVAQWHDEKRQKKELFPTGKQSSMYPLGSSYEEALRGAIRRRRERVKALGLKSRQRGDVYPPISTIQAFPPPRDDLGLLCKNEQLIGYIIEFLRENIEIDGLQIKYTITSDVYRHFQYYTNMEAHEIDHLILDLLNRQVLTQVEHFSDKIYESEETQIQLPYGIYFNILLSSDTSGPDAMQLRSACPPPYDDDLIKNEYELTEDQQQPTTTAVQQVVVQQHLPSNIQTQQQIVAQQHDDPSVVVVATEAQQTSDIVPLPEDAAGALAAEQRAQSLFPDMTCLPVDIIHQIDTSPEHLLTGSVL